VKANHGHIDWFLLLSTVGLMLFSIAFVYSASAFIAEARFHSHDKFFLNHSWKVLIGFLILLLFAKIDYHKWEKLSKPIIFMAIVPLVLVFVIGTPLNGAYRWLSIGFFNFQPSELAKFALVLHICTLLKQRQEFIKDFKIGMLPILLWSLIICSLIALQPNFSSAFVIYLITVCLLFVGNANVFHLIMIGAASITALGAYALSAPYRLQRLLSFIGHGNGSGTVNTDAAFQAQQAIIAFGNGGLFGLGPGQNRQSQLFLPESYGDFIFSIIGEEYGFFGVILLLSVFGLIVWRGVKIAKRAPDMYGYFLSFGITFTFAIYVFVSAGVNCGLLPTTGLPMPFISYGGTAIFFYAAAMGILLNISAQSNVWPKDELEGKIK
jgi:cell division protein FtsW